MRSREVYENWLRAVLGELEPGTALQAAGEGDFAGSENGDEVLLGTEAAALGLVAASPGGRGRDAPGPDASLTETLGEPLRRAGAGSPQDVAVLAVSPDACARRVMELVHVLQYDDRHRAGRARHADETLGLLMVHGQLAELVQDEKEPPALVAISLMELVLDEAHGHGREGLSREAHSHGRRKDETRGLFQEPGQLEVGLGGRHTLDGWVGEGVQLVSHALDALGEGVFAALRGGAKVRLNSRAGLLVGTLPEPVQGFLKAGIRAIGHLETPSLKALHDLFLSESHLEETLDRIKDEADLKASTDSRKYTFTERIQGVRNKLDAFAHPAIQRVTSEDADFRLARLLEGPSCLVFAAPMRMGLAGETLAAMAVRLIQHQLHQRYGHKAGRLFLILDEFSKLAMDHKQTERFISVSRSAGAVSVIILQDVDQLHHEARATIWGDRKSVV